MWITISAVARSHIVFNDNKSNDQGCDQISQIPDMIPLPEITKTFIVLSLHFRILYFSSKMQN